MKKILGLMTIFLLTTGMAAAQVGSISGTVVDATGAPVEGARVSVQDDSGCLGYVLSDPMGEFLFEEIPVGFYTVKAGLPQVGSDQVEDVAVTDGGVAVVDLVLGCTGPGGGNPHGPQYQLQKRFVGGGE